MTRRLGSVAAVALLCAAPAHAEHKEIKVRGLLPRQRVVKIMPPVDVPKRLGSAAAVKAAFHHAVELWNAQLVSKNLRLVETSLAGNIPQGEVVITSAFKTNHALFAGKIDSMAFTTTDVDDAGNHAVTQINYDDSDEFNRAAGYSLGGAADGTYDFEIVTLHEIGHAIGLDHDLTEDWVPPIMAKALETNAGLSARAKKSVAELRRIDERDVARLAQIDDVRAKNDLAGRYAGSVKYVKTTGKLWGTDVPVAGDDFTIAQDGGKLVVTYKTHTLETAAVSALLWPPLYVKDPNGAELRVVRIDHAYGAPDGEIEVSLEVHNTEEWVVLKGKLRRAPK